MFLNWLRVKLCEFIYPGLMPALDDCVKRHYQKHYEASARQQQELGVFMQDQREGFRISMQGELETKKLHERAVAALERLAEGK